MELRVEKAVREFSHDHDNGVCKPTCYGCFIIAEAKEDMRTLQLQISALLAAMNEALMRPENWREAINTALNDLDPSKKRKDEK